MSREKTGDVIGFRELPNGQRAPVVSCMTHPDTEGKVLVEECSFCGESHGHSNNPETRNLGHRVAHCGSLADDKPETGYFLYRVDGVSLDAD